MARGQSRRMRVSFGDQQVAWRLLDKPTVRNLISMPPSELEFRYLLTIDQGGRPEFNA